MEQNLSSLRLNETFGRDIRLNRWLDLRAAHTILAVVLCHVFHWVVAMWVCLPLTLIWLPGASLNDSFIKNEAVGWQILPKWILLILPMRTNNKLHEPKPLFIPSVSGWLSTANVTNNLVEGQWSIYKPRAVALSPDQCWKSKPMFPTTASLLLYNKKTVKVEGILRKPYLCYVPTLVCVYHTICISSGHHSVRTDLLLPW